MPTADLTRPQYHFTPQSGWMNDPNGLIFHNGVYHLYFQHNPLRPYFGNICWGHTTSKDLMHWKEQPIALKAYDDVMIYSGCTVFDQQNRLKQPEASIAAIYTEHVGGEQDYYERVCLAVSNDGGYTFDQAHRKIILENEDPDFRDPKVFFHVVSDQWIMVIAKPKSYAVLIYSSRDLLNWNYLSEFTYSSPRAQFWECPDLFPIIDEHGIQRWVLIVSGSNVDQETWGMFYFIGSFNGQKFSADTGPLWLDHGKDFYAGITFENLSDKRIMLAWCGNWAHANEKHTYPWRGVMSSPRWLTLQNSKLKHKLISSLEPLIVDKKADINLRTVKSILSVQTDQFVLRREWLGREETVLIKKQGSLWVYEDACLIEIIDEGGNSSTFLCDPLFD